MVNNRMDVVDNWLFFKVCRNSAYVEAVAQAELPTVVQGEDVEQGQPLLDH